VINAGLSFLPYDGTQSFNSTTLEWQGIKIQVSYPTDQTAALNPVSVNDIIVATDGLVWLVKSTSAVTSPNKYTVTIKVLNKTPSEEVSPGLGQVNRASIATPTKGVTVPYWSSTLVSEEVDRAAAFYFNGLNQLDNTSDLNKPISTAQQTALDLKLNANANAVSATKLATARTIGGVVFDGTANITLPGVNAAGTQSTTGNATSATTAAACSGNAATATTAASCSGNAATATTAASCTGNAATATSANTAASCSGNAATATKLATARTIGGVVFDGTANITLPGVNAAGTQSTTGNAATATTAAACTGNAATATKLATAQTIALTGDVTGSVSFDGSAGASITTVVANDSHTHLFANVASKPTTLTGYGITDAYTKVQVDAALTGITDGIIGRIVIRCNSWITNSFTLPSGVTVTKEYDDSSLKVIHNKGLIPSSWIVINRESTPMTAVVPTSLRNLQILNDNEIIITSISSFNSFDLIISFS
jgi:hypothetical protein